MAATYTTAIVLALAQYLRSHPQASDSLHGIARWWIDSQEPVVIDDVRRALDTLVHCGAVRCATAADGRVHYRLGDARALPDSPPAERRLENGLGH